jgi:hypothetical protein
VNDDEKYAEEGKIDVAELQGFVPESSDFVLDFERMEPI